MFIDNNLYIKNFLLKIIKLKIKHEKNAYAINIFILNY